MLPRFIRHNTTLFAADDLESLQLGLATPAPMASDAAVHQVQDIVAAALT
jgi:hypothetical protein